MFKNILKIAGLVLLVSLFFGCEEDSGTSVSDRINAFKDSLNEGDYSNLNEHFHPDMPSYSSYLDEDVFTSGPLKSGNSPFGFEDPTTSTSGSDEIAVGSFSNIYGDDIGTYSATMRKDGDDWKIYSITITISTTEYTLLGISR